MGGAAIPVGDYGGTTGSNAGFADIGYFSMVEVSKNFNSTISWTTSLSLAINGFDKNAMRKTIAPLGITTESYKSCWGMTGIRLQTSFSHEIKFYGQGQIGFLSINYPVIMVSYNGFPQLQPTASGPVLALGIGVGLIANNINIGLRFLNSSPKHIEDSGIRYSTIKLPVSILQVVVGYNI